jgi:hypothetical protein
VLGPLDHPVGMVPRKTAVVRSLHKGPPQAVFTHL